MQEEILAIVGPTASGKTELALRLARERKAEIISVDSRQVYRFLSVGTAKPTGKWGPISQSPRQAIGRGPSNQTTATMGPPPATAGDDGTKTYFVEGIPYHLVDFQDPIERFSAADFVTLARSKIAEIRARGKTPMLVGGTGLYFKALTEGLAPLPPADPALRAELRAVADREGRPHLHKELARVDPESAAKIPANNIHRVIRALEVYKLTGKPISAWHKEHQQTTAPSSGLAATFSLKGEGLRQARQDVGPLPRGDRGLTASSSSAPSPASLREGARRAGEGLTPTSSV